MLNFQHSLNQINYDLVWPLEFVWIKKKNLAVNACEKIL